MSLIAGTRLGPYEILSALGAGGMGEVYRATDTNLKRQVAIKVLPPAMADDPERLARFQREAEVLAALNHPNIAHIHGLEKADGTLALVMELVEGPTLADRITQGSIPLNEALPIAKQIAEALESAHEQGIIHRDLKPANIKVREDGTVKVLDFGLAKAMEPVAGSSASASMSPTITTPAMTQAGVILGTAAYMSPEQARGKPVDKRADIWAFGVVLFEMLTGTRAFGGDETTDTLAAIVLKDPDWSALPAATPPSIRRLLRRSIEKDRKERLSEIGTARLEIKEALTVPSAEAAPVTSGTAPAPPPWRRVAFMGVPALVAGAVIAGGAVWLATRLKPTEPVALTVETPPTSRADGFAISPDGRQLAFVAVDKDGQQKLWLRPLASTTAHVLPGTEQAASPFWSPDSRAIAFFTDRELKRIDMALGAAQTICKLLGGANGGGGTWNAEQVVLFGQYNAPGIFRVAASGGDPQQITTVNAEGGEVNHLWPQFLPDGRHFVYLKIKGPVPSEASQLMWRALDSPDEHAVRKLYTKVFYSPTGHLVFRLDGPVVAQPFDPSTGTVSGDPVQVVGDTWQNNSVTALALSPAGVLAHRAGGLIAVAQLTWIDRDGKVLATVGPAADYRNPTVDLAGELVATNTSPTGDVWLLDSRRGTTSKITSDPAADSDPVFSADGKWIAFYSGRQPAGIYRKSSNGAGADELVAKTGVATYPRDWSLDGRFLLYDTGESSGTLWALPMVGDRKPLRYPPAQSTASRVFQGHFSPDSRWIAYVSDETGRQEISVQDFPSTGAKFQVSVMGGTEPRWRRDGRELYFLTLDGRLMSVGIEPKPEFRLGVPKLLFQTRLMTISTLASRRYGVSADGQRFLMNVPVGGDSLSPITVVVNWPSLLKK